MSGRFRDMARFVAIPVRVGDAFYLERDGRSVLVDGGKSKLAFPELFRTHVNPGGVDVVVCTHNDADHANGIIGFLEAGFTCREIWLPGHWLGVAKDVLRQSSMVIQDVVRGAIEYWNDIGKEQRQAPRSLEEVGIVLSQRELSKIESKPAEGNDSAHWPEPLVEAFQDSEASGELQDWEPWWQRYIPVPCGLISNPPRFWQIVTEAIEAAERIRHIARLAFDNGIPVRWFEYSPSESSGGIPSFLRPVGASLPSRPMQPWAWWGSWILRWVALHRPLFEIISSEIFGIVPTD